MRTLALLAAIFLVKLPLAAQDPPTAVPDSLKPLIEEFQALQQRLERVQMQVLDQSEELRTRQDQVAELVSRAAVELRPEVRRHMERLRQIQPELLDARVRQDTDRMQELVEESDLLNQEIQAAQELALLQDSRIAEQVQSFQDALLTAMEAVDPEIKKDLERLQELAKLLESSTGGEAARS